MGIRKKSLPQKPTIEALVQTLKLACTVPCRISETTAASGTGDTGPAKDLLCAPEMVLTENSKGTNLSEKMKRCKQNCVTPRSLICKFTDELHHHQPQPPFFCVTVEFCAMAHVNTAVVDGSMDLLSLVDTLTLTNVRDMYLLHSLEQSVCSQPLCFHV